MPVLCAGVVMGCSDAANAPAHLVRDSADVQIVESWRPQWNDSTAWRVGDRALLRIGALDGDPSLQFSGIVGATRLADGSVVVADGGSRELRYFAADGRLRKVTGGAGAGPREFTNLSAVGSTRTGTVWAYDFTLRRISWLDADGQSLALTTLAPEPPVLSAVGALPDGSFVLRQLWGARRVAAATHTGMRRDPVAYVRFGRDGVLQDTIGTFAGRELILTEEDGRGVMTTPVYGRNSVGVVWGDLLVVGSGNRFQLDVYSAAGALRRSMRLPQQDLALRAQDVAAEIDRRVHAAPVEERARIRRFLEAQPRPTTRPAHGALRVDEAGNVWVAEWLPEPQIPRNWLVLAADGRWLGDVRMPPGFQLIEIGRDWILGLERDSLDVESVVIYPLIRSGS